MPDFPGPEGLKVYIGDFVKVVAEKDVRQKESTLAELVGHGIEMERLAMVSFQGRPNYQEIWLDGRPIVAFEQKIEWDGLQCVAKLKSWRIKNEPR